MCNEFKKTEDVIKEFMKKNSNRMVKTLEAEIKYINPQKIIAINNVYDYSEIVDDHKMRRLKALISVNGWNDSTQNAIDFCLLELPNGDLIANGNGNHRAVLTKEYGYEKVKANVSKVIYFD